MQRVIHVEENVGGLNVSYGAFLLGAGMLGSKTFVPSLSGVGGIEVVYSVLQLFKANKPPVAVSPEGIELSIPSMEPDVFYEVQSGEDKIAFRLTPENILETYEIVPS